MKLGYAVFAQVRHKLSNAACDCLLQEGMAIDMANEWRAPRAGTTITENHIEDQLAEDA